MTTQLTPQNETTYPCLFHLKVMGRALPEFEIAALSIVKKHVKNLAENSIRIRESTEKKYRSLTLSFTADNKEMLDALYAELSKHPDILMVL